MGTHNPIILPISLVLMGGSKQGAKVRQKYDNRHDSNTPEFHAHQLPEHHQPQSVRLMHDAMQVEGALRELSRKQAELESREKQLDEANGTSSAGPLALVTNAATTGGALSAGEHEGTEWQVRGCAC